MKNSVINSKMMRSLVRTGLVFLIISNCIFRINAQVESSEDKTLSPYFMVLSDDPSEDHLPLKMTSAEVNIVGVIADVIVTQEYKNEGKNPIEAIYTFPASTNAAVYAMEMTIGDRKIIAQIKERVQARKEYEKAKEEGKRTSLLEQQRPNVFQMNVANIMPGDLIKVELKYTEMLIPENGTYTFVYPTVVGPRYSEFKESTATTHDQFISTPYQKAGEASFYNFYLSLDLLAGMPIQNVTCPSHKIITNYPQPSIAEVKLDPTESKGGNRDFVFEYQLAGERISSGLMLYENGDENFFLLTVQPPKKVTLEDIPPREYIFIVDVSGSMNGFPLSVTKELLRNLVVNLRHTDLFNIMVFAGTSGWMAEESVYANTANVEKAIQFMTSQRGGGGTRLMNALQKAFTFPRKEESLSRSFVIVTDGYISVEKEVFDLIRKNNDQANTFAFGIGSSVNRFLIEGMARAGMGEPMIVLNSNEAYKEAEKFRKYINSPVLTQVKKVFSGFEVYDVEPLTIPDVLAERPVIIYGKYRGKAEGTIKIKGFTGKKRYTSTINVKETIPDKNNAAIRYLWARKRIQMLDDYNKLSNNEEAIKEVTRLGLKYKLLTAYTSFLAVEHKVVNRNGKPQSVKQPLPLPQGVSNAAVGFDMELDEEDFAFTFHKEIIITEELIPSLKATIQHKIENNIIIGLSTCLSNYPSFIEKIEVTIDANGKVCKINIEGKNISNELEQCIRTEILNWDFNQYQVNKTWKFQISF
ncbi:VIT domain-containing protein [candidate division KSB1 bacterium]